MPSAQAGVRNICIVDDDADIRESLRFLFEEIEYRVEEVANGLGALRFLEAAEQPWIVLLDRMMPRMDGIEVLHALAQAPQIAWRTAVVFMTARGDPPDAASARLIAEQTVATIAKPFHLDTLVEAVERAGQQLAERLAVE